MGLISPACATYQILWDYIAKIGNNAISVNNAGLKVCFHRGATSLNSHRGLHIVMLLYCRGLRDLEIAIAWA